MGLTQPEFPFGQRGQRGVIAVSFVLIVIAIAGAILTDP
jgi:Flp pilus assembly protein TadG